MTPSTEESIHSAIVELLTSYSIPLKCFSVWPIDDDYKPGTWMLGVETTAAGATSLQALAGDISFSHGLSVIDYEEVPGRWESFATILRAVSDVADVKVVGDADYDRTELFVAAASLSELLAVLDLA